MGKVVAFRDPQAALEGEEEAAALEIYRPAVAAIAARVIAAAFTEASRTPGCERLGCEAVLPDFVAAFRAELARAGF